MPTRDVKVSLPDEMLFDTASKAMGIAGISANALIKAALRLYNGEDKGTVIAEARTQSDLRGTTKKAKVSDELLKGIDNAAYAARVGLGLAMGMEREQAENWAKNIVKHGGKREGAGRPRTTKEEINVP